MNGTIQLYCHNCGDTKTFNPENGAKQLCGECRQKLKIFLDEEYKRGYDAGLKEGEKISNSPFSGIIQKYVG